jgi:hypothetical protein
MGWNRKCSDPPLWVRNGYTHAVVRCIIYPDTVGHVLLRLIPGDTIFCHSGVHRNMTCHEFGFCSLPTLLVPLLHRRFRAHRTHRRERAPCQDNTKSPFASVSYSFTVNTSYLSRHFSGDFVPFDLSKSYHPFAYLSMKVFIS